MKWHDLFEYTDGILYRKSNKGKSAGTLNLGNRVQITVGKKFFYRYRIIWEMHNGAIPEGKMIDHRNRNPNDDRIENLRLVNKSQNASNSKVRKDNSTGYRGVAIRKNRKKPYYAYFVLDQKQICIGYFATAEEASIAREIAAKHAFGEFYSELA